MEKFLNNLVRLRKLKYPSARQFAIALGIPYQTYMTYESETRSAEPKYELLIKMATLLGVTTDELLGYVCTEKVNFAKDYEQFQGTKAKIIKLLDEQENRILRILKGVKETELSAKIITGDGNAELF